MSYDTRRRLLHILWTKAVGTPKYDRKEWQELERELLSTTYTPQNLSEYSQQKSPLFKLRTSK